jgi:hypothetical protein
MESPLQNLSMAQLAALHKQAEQDLHQALLNGDSWHEVRSKRQTVTEIAIHMHKRKNPEHFPGINSERRPDEDRNGKP